MTDFTSPQLMVAAAAREIADGEIVFVGMRLPLLGFLLAKSTHAPHAVGVYELGVVRDDMAPAPILTMGDLPNLYRALWLADTADMMGLLQSGSVDVSFIGGAQVDRFGNLNTSYIGGVENVQTRLPGSGGACDLASLARRHIIIMAHERRRFLPRVDYITSPGYGDGPGWRATGGASPRRPVRHHYHPGRIPLRPRDVRDGSILSAPRRHRGRRSGAYRLAAQGRSGSGANPTAHRPGTRHDRPVRPQRLLDPDQRIAPRGLGCETDKTPLFPLTKIDLAVL